MMETTPCPPFPLFNPINTHADKNSTDKKCTQIWINNVDEPLTSTSTANQPQDTKLPFKTIHKLLAYMKENEEELPNIVSLQIGSSQGRSSSEASDLPKNLKKLPDLQSMLASSSSLSEAESSEEEWPETTQLPDLTGFTKLEKLTVNGCRLTDLPKSIWKLKLKELDLAYNRLDTISEDIKELPSLQKLVLDHNDLSSLPNPIGTLLDLEQFSVKDNKLTKLPDLNNPKLSRLNVSRNNLDTLPNSVFNLPELTTLYADRNAIKSIPKNIGDAKKLKRIRLHDNKLRGLPKSFEELKNLEELSLENNQFTSFPPIEPCVHLARLSIDRALYKQMPPGIKELELSKKLKITKGNSPSCLKRIATKIQSIF